MKARTVRSAIVSLLVAFCLSFPTMAQGEGTNAGDERSKRKTVRRLMKAARDSYDRGEVGLSMEYLDSVLTVDAANADASFYKGKLLARQGDTAGATVILHEAIAKSPRSARLRLYLARLYLKQGKTEEAIQETDGILMFRPRDSLALYLKGLGQLQLGDTLVALDQLEQALKLALEKGEK